LFSLNFEQERPGETFFLNTNYWYLMKKEIRGLSAVVGCLLGRISGQGNIKSNFKEKEAKKS
jgi:hypothetical protein